MLKKLEVLTNVAILVAAILASAVLIKNLRAPSSAATPAPPPQIEIGSRTDLVGVDWHRNGNTLVMALQTSCHFCSESAPFYRRLATELPSERVHLMAVLPQTPKEGVAYLKSLDVPLEDVRQGSFQNLKLRVTPTLLLVDGAGIVRRIWVGKLTADKEQEVVKALLEVGKASTRPSA